MNKNIKKFLSVILVFLLSVSVIPNCCIATDDKLCFDKESNISIKEWFFELPESNQSVVYDRCFEVVASNPTVIYHTLSEWLLEIYKDKIKPWFSDLLKSDEQVNNTFVSLLYHFGKRSVINIGKGSAKFVAWAWKTLFRTPGALAEWLGGYKSNKIADKSGELKELQKTIDLCNKNETCKAVLSDILKNAEKN